MKILTIVSTQFTSIVAQLISTFISFSLIKRKWSYLYKKYFFSSKNEYNDTLQQKNKVQIWKSKFPKVWWCIPLTFQIVQTEAIVLATWQHHNEQQLCSAGRQNFLFTIFDTFHCFVNCSNIKLCKMKTSHFLGCWQFLIDL